jgi:hypothetical protein
MLSWQVVDVDHLTLTWAGHDGDAPLGWDHSSETPSRKVRDSSTAIYPGHDRVEPFGWDHPFEPLWRNAWGMDLPLSTEGLWTSHFGRKSPAGVDCLAASRPLPLS